MKSSGSSTTHSRQSARKSGLRWVSDEEPGFIRRGRGNSFSYVNTRGQVIRNTSTLNRIRSLAIPPAWKDVWICKSPRGHLQATGRDARDRKQYLYHPKWREVRDEGKYSRLVDFARALPRIRKKVGTHLLRRGLVREKVLATIVKLLESTAIRVGNDEYARDNHSFGLTTMKDRHVKVRGRKILFSFRGKSKVEHEVCLDHPRLAGIVRRCQDLPGQELFQYVDESDKVQNVNSADVNDYLREISKGDFTAKDFRTWTGTVVAARTLRPLCSFDSKSEAAHNVTQAVEQVAETLGNTKAISRKCYIHPAVFDAYFDKTLCRSMRKHQKGTGKRAWAGLSSEEGSVLAMLQQRMKHDGGKVAKTPSRKRS